MSKCCDPKAPYVPCIFCDKLIKLCEQKIAINGDYTCPQHPGGIELSDGNWVCSESCYDDLLESKKNVE